MLILLFLPRPPWMWFGITKIAMRKETKQCLSSKENWKSFEFFLFCRLYKKDKIPAQQQQKSGHFRNTFLSFFCTPRVKVYGYEFLHIRNTHMCDCSQKNIQKISRFRNLVFKTSSLGPGLQKAAPIGCVLLMGGSRTIIKGVKHANLSTRGC